jgi:hypothetical protein
MLQSYKEIDDLLICTCACHGDGGKLPDVEVSHIGPCCSKVACGKRIVIGGEEQHALNCSICSAAMQEMINETSLEDVEAHVTT